MLRFDSDRVVAKTCKLMLTLIVIIHGYHNYVTSIYWENPPQSCTFWYHIKALVPENSVIPKPKPCSVPFQSYGCFKNDIGIHVNGDISNS